MTCMLLSRQTHDGVLDKMRSGQFLLDFDTQRQQMLSDLREASSGFVYAYDKRTEALQISDTVNQALVAGAGLNLAGLGILGFMMKATLLGATGIFSTGMSGGPVGRRGCGTTFEDLSITKFSLSFVYFYATRNVTGQCLSSPRYGINVTAKSLVYASQMWTSTLPDMGF